MKRIMILGAGHFQLPAIKKAVESGYEVITVDYLPDNIGHRYSHRYVNCSTTDEPGVLRAAEELEVDGICTFSSDVAVATVGYVSERLSLPGLSYRQAIQLTRKSEFRQFLRQSQLPSPHFVCGESFDGLVDTFSDFRFPVLCKPVDTSGSRGVTRVDEPDPILLRRAFNDAKAFSRSGAVCIEEFIKGIEVGGDAFLLDGRIIFIAITNKFLHGFVVSGHSLPSVLSDAERERVVKAVQDCCDAAGYTDGPLNFDVMLSDRETYLLEVSPRNGGNGIPTIIKYATGLDIERATLHFSASDRNAVTIPPNPGRSAGSFVFGSPAGGRITSLLDEQQMYQETPELLHLFYNHTEGDVVEPFIHSGNMVGYCVFRLTNPGEYCQVKERIKKALSLTF